MVYLKDVQVWDLVRKRNVLLPSRQTIHPSIEHCFSCVISAVMSENMFTMFDCNISEFNHLENGNLLKTSPNIAQRTRQPITTGTSVLGMKFEGGVIIAADVLGSYGSLARFRSCPRIIKVNDTTILGAGGDYADFQFLTSVIEQKVIDEECLHDGFNLKPKSLHCWLTRILYNRRSRFDPLWTTLIVGGIQDGEPFLGHVDKIGTAYEAPTIATGFGAYLAQPMLAQAYEASEGKLTQGEAADVIKKCLRVLYYRDARSFPKFQMAVVTKDGVKILGPVEIDSNWDIAYFIRPPK